EKNSSDIIFRRFYPSNRLPQPQRARSSPNLIVSEGGVRYPPPRHPQRHTTSVVMHYVMLSQDHGTSRIVDYGERVGQSRIRRDRCCRGPSSSADSPILRDFP